MQHLIHVSERARALVMNPSNPELLFTLLPQTRRVSVAGHQLVAVPHNLDVVSVLRNLGAPAPSPILHHYQWPGRFPPMQAQRQTAAFLTLNRRAFVLNDMGCVDAATEYLSPTGWKRIDQYDGGLVAQYHPDTGAAEFVQPTEYVKRPCAQMFRVKTKYGVDQLLSPEHRVLLRAKANERKTEVVSAEELYRRNATWASGEKSARSHDAIGWTQAAIPVTFCAPGGTGIPMTDAQIRVQVAVIADGHFANNTTHCTVRLKKPRKIARMRQLLEAARTEWKERLCATGFTVFTFYAPTTDKSFGAAWWGATPAQLKVVADEVMHWDGSVSSDKPGARFSTTVGASADFVQYAFAGTGRTARVTVAVRDGKPEYNVQVREHGRPLQLASLGSHGERHMVVSPEPSPDGFKYCFMVPSTFLLFRRNGCVFASGNTGKTMSALWAFDYLRSIGALRRCIVFAPLSTLNATWASEILLGFPHLKYAVLHADRTKRLKMLEQDNDVYIINHHGVKIVQEALVARPDIDLAIVDELSVFRTPGTDLFKSMQKVTAMPSRWVWGMTGTPTPNAPTDAWAQVRLLRPAQVPNYFKAFKEQTMLQVAPFKWVPRKNSTETVQAVMQPSIRYTREECMDLPPTTWLYRDVEMSPEQKRLYQEMKTKLRLEYESGQAKAVNEADKAMKLVQIACGAVRDSVSGEPILVPTGQRLEEAIAAIQEARGKVLVFVPFVAALHALRDELARHWPTALVYGETPKAERDDIFARFQHGTSDDLHVVVANARVMSHGLTLTSADTVLWYGAPTSHEVFDQACHRIIRKGQVRNTRAIMLRGCKVEQELYARLTDRREMQGSLLAAIASEKED